LGKRGCGILLHITSLPSPYGIGDMGTDAYRFADFLAESGQKYWQILPLNNTCAAYGNSPYSSFSAFAGSHLLLSPDQMVNHGFLSKSDIKNVPSFSDTKVDYGAVTEFKNKLFCLAYESSREKLLNHKEFQRFCNENAHWLDDYTLFISIKNHLKGVEWSQWPEGLRDRKGQALKEYTEKLSDNIFKEKFLQFMFFNQWLSLKNYCESKGIKIFGDIPIYVNYDSADVWAHQVIFSLDEDKKPLFVAGVPPDYFSSTGQLWGHPVYNWDVIKETEYAWWLKRIEHNLTLFHMFRLDHFRGFVGYWQVHASEKTAINGKWVDAPAEDFFNTIMSKFPGISIIAEDLGIITQDVRDIMWKFELPGMKVLLFAFVADLANNPYAPHNHVKNCVIYTGTHDNNTVKGWFQNELKPEDKNRISEYIGKEISEKTIHSDMIRLAMMSVANMAIIPMQDILGLGGKDRMNLPGHPDGNWEWRITWDKLSPSLAEELSVLAKRYGRN
jgi:4-alpha-glucanotransferase